MTNSSRHRSTSGPEFRLTRPGALIAALPAVLGFSPQNSLVLVTIEHGQLGAVMRADLPTVLEGGVENMVDVAASSGSEAVIAVIVDGEGACCLSCADNYVRLSEDLEDALGEQGVELLATHVVDEVAAGGRWHCVDHCGAGGEVEDPAASPLAVAAVLDGRRLYANRAELENVVGGDGSEPGEQIADAIEELVESGEMLEADDAMRRRVVEEFMAAAERVAGCCTLSDTEIAWLAYGLTDLTVRDTLYGLAIGESAGAAETLWAELARALPESWRAEALTLLAFFAYARGDGPLAGVALQQALRLESEHRMARMLDTALQSGMRPQRIRQLALTGYRLAERIGVQFPPRRRFGRRAG